MVWVMLGPLGVADRQRTSGSSPAQKGLMVATPVLAGRCCASSSGVLVDRYAPKLAGIIGQVDRDRGAAARHGWLGVDSFAGKSWCWVSCSAWPAASFAVALPLASRWYPPEHQGTALGIAGAGNSGTVLAALFAPSLAIAFGWQQRARIWP